MTQMQTIGLRLEDTTPRGRQAHEDLTRALGDAEVGEPDEAGVFEVTLAAADHEAGLRRVWDAIAAAGADDHIVFLEHPDVPEHWRRRPTGA